jgi:predicted  nucleic acid-binding Zn-ribbon protein
MTDSTSQVRRRAFGSVLSNAIVRWESLIIAGVTAVAYFAIGANGPFPGWQAWFWLAGGVLAEIALVLAHITDPEEQAQAIAREFEQRFDLRRIKSPVSRERLQRAIEYRRNMMELASRARGAMRTSLQQTIADVNDWISHMYDLALHIDAFDANVLVERDRQAVPQQLQKARVRLERETDPNVQRDLQQQIRTLELQMNNLETTANSVKRAEIQLDSTLSSLGTIYAQMSLLGSKEVDSARAQRLRNEIADEVSGLQDTIAAMDEVQAQRLRLQ